ncbi:MAG: pilin [bacterium]|nr:pilin [bacterium]
MVKKYSKIIFSFLFTVIVISSFVYVQFCQASQLDLKTQLGTTGAKGWGSQITDASAMPQIIQTVISAFLGLLGIIFLVLIIYAGYNWMTAQGEEEKVTKAKDTLTRAIIGLIIITSAYAITYFVFSSLPGGGGGTPSSNPVVNTGDE